jgi:uncharacterized protein
MTQRGTALVTGASAGLGAVFADRLAARGHDLVLVARRGDRLDALASRLRGDHGVAVVPLVQDLSEPGAAGRVREQVRATGRRIEVLVNNAGLGTGAPFLDSSVDDVRRQLMVNAVALTELAHHFAEDLVAAPPGRGALVNVASMAAAGPVPGLAVYAASKAYVLRLTSALGVELGERGVHVVSLVPGATRTEFWQQAGMREQGTPFQTPEQVVDVAMRELHRRRPRTRTVSGWYNRIAFAVARLLPEGPTMRASARAMRASG